MTEQAPGIADPTIEQVLEEFLDDQEARLAPRTFSKYRDVVELLKHSLNGYAYEGLDPRERELFDRYFNIEGEEHREFCAIFGPEHILPNLEHFFGYFVIRKVGGSKELGKACGTVTRKLARWLAERGLAAPDEADVAAERARRAGRELPEADELARLLFEFTESQPERDVEAWREGHFVVTGVRPGAIELEEMLGGGQFGPVEVPPEVSRRLPMGWTISGAVGCTSGHGGKRRWWLLEAWNVYPE